MAGVGVQETSRGEQRSSFAPSNCVDQAAVRRAVLLLHEIAARSMSRPQRTEARTKPARAVSRGLWELWVWAAAVALAVVAVAVLAAVAVVAVAVLAVVVAVAVLTVVAVVVAVHSLRESRRSPGQRGRWGRSPVSVAE